MLTKVDVIAASGRVLTLSLLDPTNGYLVHDVSGLDPVVATIVSSRFAQRDGTQYQASRREDRNIVIKLGLEPDYVTSTVSQLRQDLYTYLMPKSNVTLRFYLDDQVFAEIQGRVENLASVLFTQDPEVTISILCFDPDFYALVPTTLSGSTTSTTDETIFNYTGSTETGFIFRLAINRAVTEVVLYNDPLVDVTQSLDFVGILQAGDVLEISTITGAKRAVLIRGGVRSSVLYGVSPASNWLNFYPGENRFRAAVSGAAIPYTIEYTTKYGGL